MIDKIETLEELYRQATVHTDPDYTVMQRLAYKAIRLVRELYYIHPYIAVETFSKKYKLPQVSTPSFVSEDITNFRINFMQEELDEFKTAVADKDLAGAFDALIDLTYVVLGTAYFMNLPFIKGWEVVHTCNMSKVRVLSALDSERGSAYDVVKPKGWVAPDLKPLLKERSK